MSLKGNPQTLKSFAKKLSKVSTVAAQAVATRAAAPLTSRAGSDYDGGRTAYGEARPPGVNGNALSLVKSGDTRSLLRFTSIGTRVRVVLGTPYAKFLIGKYKILPNSLPRPWATELERITGEELRKVAS